MLKINGNQLNPQDMIPGLDRSDKPGISLQEWMLSLNQLSMSLEAMIQSASKSSELTSQLYQKSRQENSKKLNDPESTQRSKNECMDDSDKSNNPEDTQGPATFMRKWAPQKKSLEQCITPAIGSKSAMLEKSK